MLEFILLGLLRRPQSGYDLKARFRRGAAHFWSADLSQIYRTLQRLEDRDWLASAFEPSETGPERRVYRRTRAGAAALRAWLQRDPIQPATRLPYVAQLFFHGELNDLDRTCAFLEALREELRARVAVLEAIEQEGEFHAMLTLQLGLATARARLAWCGDALRKTRRRARSVTA